MTASTDRRGVVIVPWLSWGLVAGAAIATALAATWVALTPMADQTELEDRTWEGFAQQDPEVARLWAMDVGILGLLGAGFGLLAAVVALGPYRRGERWAWSALWLFPLMIGAVAVRMIVERYSAGPFYAVLSAVAAACLLLPARRFLRS